jgi:hypothetical protein
MARRLRYEKRFSGCGLGTEARATENHPDAIVASKKQPPASQKMREAASEKARERIRAGFIPVVGRPKLVKPKWMFDAGKLPKKPPGAA